MGKQENKVSKKVQNLIDDLNSKDDKKILAAVKSAFKHGSHQVIPSIIEVLITTKNDFVYEQICNLLNQLKSTEAVEYIIDCVLEQRTEGHKHVLVASLWESGQDVNHHLSTLVDVAIKEDYLTCLECLTVIENMEFDHVDESQMLELAALVKENLNQGDEKDALLLSLMEVLKGFVL